MNLTKEQAFAIRDSGRVRSFFEAMEIDFWERIETMTDENGVVHPPAFVAESPLTCEDRVGLESPVQRQSNGF